MRCRPGDLAEIVRSEAGNEGRRVVVERLAEFELMGQGPEWVVLPLQPLRMVMWTGGRSRFIGKTMQRSTFPDAWLRPIRDPLPGEGERVATTETAEA